MTQKEMSSWGRTGAARRSRRGQVGVMDRGLAAVLGAAAMLGLIGVYFHNTADVAADNQVDQINTIGAEVARLYGAQSSQYQNITAQVIAQSGSIPPQWTDAAQANLISVYKSTIALAAVTNPATNVAFGAWTMTINNVPQAACSVLLTTTYAPTMLGSAINGGAVGTVSLPIADPAIVTNKCKTGMGANGMVASVSFTFS